MSTGWRSAPTGPWPPAAPTTPSGSGTWTPPGSPTGSAVSPGLPTVRTGPGSSPTFRTGPLAAEDCDPSAEARLLRGRPVVGEALDDVVGVVEGHPVDVHVGGPV